MTKRKILIIVENLPVPFDTRVWKEARALCKHGYDVTVLCPQGKGFRKVHEVLEGVHIYRHPMPPEGNSPSGYVWEYGCALFWEFLFTWWIFLARGFDVIQGCNPPDDIFLVALPFRLFGVRYIFDHHDAIPELYLSKYDRRDLFFGVQSWLERLTFACSSVVMATNESYKALAISRGGLNERDVFVVRNGPDLGSFGPVKVNPALKYGKAYLVGYVGTMSIQDGLDILIDVAANIRARGRSDIHFTCVGGGPSLPALRRLLKDKNLEDMFNFTGRVSDSELLEVLSTSDVGVNPDKPCEMNDISTMIKIAEYMALSKPIVQFDLKEGRFTAGDASLYSKGDDLVADFADKILWLLDHSDERERMGKFGRKRVEECLAWEHSESNLIAAYERVFEKRGQTQRIFSKSSDADNYLSTYFRCPQEYARVTCEEPLSVRSGYFRFGEDAEAYGSLAGRSASREPGPGVYDAAEDVRIVDGAVHLPFDLSVVVDNLLSEAYVDEWRHGTLSSLSKPYYLIRPLLPVGIRRHLQKFYLRGWDKIAFPRWPVDCSIDNLLERLLVLTLRATGADRIPFIWFWPDGHKGCALMTHDVETEIGRDFCSTLMDIDDSFGIKASFQIVPEERYSLPAGFINEIRRRQHEIAIHDLNHDGHLYKNRAQFVERAAKINAYGREFKTGGFRGAVLYRKQVWYDELGFAYDMSVPNVAHLDPQRGGCCTVMPYFIGKILEIPVTTIQDYTLFNILNDYSMQIWKQQTDIIVRKFGLMSFIIHPDYVIEPRARAVYMELLQHLADLREKASVWVTTPSEVNRWWRQRAEMRLASTPEGWVIENPGDSRARVAFASLDGDRLVYEIEHSSACKQSTAKVCSSGVAESTLR